MYSMIKKSFNLKDFLVFGTRFHFLQYSMNKQHEILSILVQKQSIPPEY